MIEKINPKLEEGLPSQFSKWKGLPQICYLCGTDLGSDFTVDHLPPQGVFPQIDKSLLLKVHTCRKCHPTRQQSMDDEYFRNCLIEWVGKEKMPSEIVENRSRAWRERPLQELDILLNAKPILIQSNSGLIERRFEVTVQSHRIIAVLERAGRGFHFSRFKRRIPALLPTVYLNKSSILSEERDRLVYPFAPGFILVPGRLIVRYWSFQQGALNESNWVFQFYNKVEFVIKFEWSN